MPRERPARRVGFRWELLRAWLQGKIRGRSRGLGSRDGMALGGDILRKTGPQLDCVWAGVCNGAGAELPQGLRGLHGDVLPSDSPQALAVPRSPVPMGSSTTCLSPALRSGLHQTTCSGFRVEDNPVSVRRWADWEMGALRPEMRGPCPENTPALAEPGPGPQLLTLNPVLLYCPSETCLL